MSDHGWAIAANDKEYRGLLGKYWWFGNRPHAIPTHMMGYKVAVFRTRRDAREALKYVKSDIYGFPNAKVVKVQVAVVWGGK